MVAGAFFFVSLLAIASAKPAKRDFVVRSKRDVAPQGFAPAGKADDSATINLRIGLYSNDIEGLQKKLYDVSTPSSSSYGQHLSTDEIKSHVAPADDAVKAVNDWLSSHGLQSSTASPSGDWLSVSVPVSKADELLDANYEVYTHLDSGKQIIRTLSYSVPADLQAHIETVHPTSSFNRPLVNRPTISSPISAASGISPDASCSTTVTPACLQSLYGIPSTPATQSSNQIAVAGFIGQYAQKADLKTFLTKYRTDLSSSTAFALQTLDGGSNPQKKSDAGIEANLDIQYTVGVASGVPVVFISVGDNYQDGDLEGFLDIVNYLLGESSRPQIMTTSYGENESDIEESLAVKLCNAYMQLGAAGTSVLFASGDGGVSGGQSQSCSKFQPAFPAVCPYLTAVGATQGTSPETAASFSSGGFSNYFSQPSFQSSAVSTYLTALGSEYKGLFTPTGRGFPDVSAQGVNVEIVSGGTVEGVDGTSCASPIFASVIALINDRLIAAGKPALGFLNPWLYANAAALNDITSGSNPGCNTNGFPAKTGWDPVTGLGTPAFAKLLAAAGL